MYTQVNPCTDVSRVRADALSSEHSIVGLSVLPMPCRTALQAQVTLTSCKQKLD